MKSFKIVFYKSEGGEIVHVKTFFRLAEQLADLIKDPPEEFFDMLDDYSPMHGWAEVEPTRCTVFVIFVPKNAAHVTTDDEASQFREWLGNVKPSDFSQA